MQMIKKGSLGNRSNRLWQFILPAVCGIWLTEHAKAHNGPIGNSIRCEASVNNAVTAKGQSALVFGTQTNGIDLLEGQTADIQTTISYSCHNPTGYTSHTRLCFNINGGSQSPSQYTPRLLTHTTQTSNTLQFQLYKPDGSIWGSNATGSGGSPYMTEMLIIRPGETSTGTIPITARLINNQQTVKPFTDGTPYEADFTGLSASLNWYSSYWDRKPENCGAFYSSNNTFPFIVQAYVAPMCKITSAEDIDFGTHTAGSSNLRQQGNLRVRCTNGTPYSIGLVPSNGNQEGKGEMKSVNNAATNTDKVPYQLRKGSAANAHFWGNNESGSGSVKANQTGDGSEQVHTVHAEVKETDFTPDEYQDKVTVHVKY